ncbi:hypothetical protein Tco_0909249 [Tanacetum coccineum]|uniref:Uncharacterized protein n=1 Tax=Tanacetum coccineum TaxID=301880 RepID=A0ABQ5CWN9_9ASTR
MMRLQESSESYLKKDNAGLGGSLRQHQLPNDSPTNQTRRPRQDQNNPSYFIHNENGNPASSKSTSNKLMVERFYTSAGNPVKEILLKLNLPDHRKLKDGGEVVSNVISGILSIEARDIDTKLLSPPESNNTLAICWFRRNVPVTTFGSRHDKLLILVADCFKWLGASLTQGTVASIHIVFSWGGSIRPESFLPSALLLMVIIVAVAIVMVVVAAIIGVVVVVASAIIKLSFVIIGSLHRIMPCYLIH